MSDRSEFAWILLKRLVGLMPATPMTSQEGQLRYDRAEGAATGKLWLARPKSGTMEWSDLTGVDAPADARYIVQTANATLTNEQALAALATGVLKSTTGTGVLSIAVGADLPSHTHAEADVTALVADLAGKQPLDAELTALAGLTSAADRLPYFTGSGAAALATFTAAGRALAGDADAAAQRTTLGLGTIATKAQTSGGTIQKGDGAGGLTAASAGVDYYNPGGTDVALADGGTAASTAAGARANLGLAIGADVQAWDADLDVWAGKTAPSGTVVGTTDSQTLTNKTQSDSTSFFGASGDLTKRFRFAVGGIATGTDRVYTVPNANGSLALLDTGYATPPGPVVVDTTTVTALVSQQCAARYLGMVPSDVGTVVVELRVTTAAATITWAEVALASANSATGGNLTLLSSQSVSAVFNSTGNKTVTFSTAVPAGTYLYLLAGSQATTPFQLRATLADELGVGFVRLASTTRPSTMASPTVFTTSATGVGAIACYVRWS